MLSCDKERQIYCYNKEQFLYTGFSPFAETENQEVSLPRAADKTSGLKCNQILHKALRQSMSLSRLHSSEIVLFQLHKLL